MLKYPTQDQFLAITSQRQNGVSIGPYASNNMSYIVGDDKEHVALNREALAKQINLDLSHWVFVKQSHSDQIQKVSHDDKGRGAYDHQDGIEGVDALYTFDANLMLAFYHADCVPLLLFDETTNLIAAIHAGWQGTLKEITKKSLETLIKKESIDPKNLKVLIGPCISFESSEVLLSQIETPIHFNDHIVKLNDDKIKINAAQLNIEQCLQYGVLLENISRFDTDTFSDDTNYFSFQRDGMTGRHISGIARIEAT